MNFDPAKLAKDRVAQFAAVMERQFKDLPEHTQAKVLKNPIGADADLLAHHVKSEMRGLEMEAERKRLFSELPKALRDVLYHDQTHPAWDEIDEAAEKAIAQRQEILERWMNAEGVEAILL